MAKEIKLPREETFKKFMTLEPRLNRVCVLEDLNFWWDEKELREIRKLWKKEFSINYMAEYFERDPDEVLLAIIHLAKEDRIGRRKSGLLNL